MNSNNSVLSCTLHNAQAANKTGLFNLLSLIFGIALLFAFSSVYASDKAKEKRWAEQVEDALMDGESLYLNDGKEDFLALEIPAEEGSELGIVVMHGIGIHPDWTTIVNPLRVGLAEAGWHTLSIQMPVLENGASGKDYDPLMQEVGPRIEAAISHLQKMGAKKVVLVAHSLGSRMTSHYLAARADSKEKSDEFPVIAYVGVGMNAGNVELLKKISLPMLDLYGSEDLDGVVGSAEDRAKSSSHNKAYKQQKVEGADHFFEGKDDELVEVVSSYIKSL